MVILYTCSYLGSAQYEMLHSDNLGRHGRTGIYYSTDTCYTDRKASPKTTNK